jgi:GYF domain 2
MSNRSWFYAANGQQQGPFPEAQLRDLITRGTVRADTLVWSEGMSGWQRAGEIPGLIPGGSGPPLAPQPGGAPSIGGSGYGGGPLSFDFDIWEFVWRSLLFLLGMVLVIPGPWVILMYTRWLVSCTRVPGRPNLTFTGQVITIVWWYFGAIVLAIAISYADFQFLNLVEFLIQLALYWLFIRWFFANLASEGQPLGISFSGSYWAYLGWNILAVLAIFTIIGWAWVYTAWMRWFCRNIQGTRREVLFIGTGLEFLWRAIVAALASIFIIPIPWVYRWIWQWLASQTVLVERGAHASA